jgi:hypothetical protein
MASLTPLSRSAEVVDNAMKEGLVSGGLVLFPSMGGLYLALKNPKFRKVCSSNKYNRSIFVATGFFERMPEEKRMAVSRCFY